MALTINTNTSSIVAQRNLDSATKSLNTAIERMTTGYKINHASDNAAGYSIARNWSTQLSSLDVAADNAATGSDMLTTVEDTYSLIASHVQRIRDLTEQAANGTYGKDSLVAIESEIKARLDEINRISANCEFNGTHLMNGSATNGITANVNIQVGLYSDANSKITLDSSLFASASVAGLFSSHGGDLAVTGGKTLLQVLKAANNNTDLAISDATLGFQATEAAKHAFASACAGLVYNAGAFTKQTGADYTAEKMLTFLDSVMADISSKTTALGAAQNRIDSAIESISVQSENITSSLSTLRDADVAKESSSYIQSQILQQAAATLLATANQTPSIALNLL